MYVYTFLKDTLNIWSCRICLTKINELEEVGSTSLMMNVGSIKRCTGWMLLSSVICLYVHPGYPVEAVETVPCELAVENKN